LLLTAVSVVAPNPAAATGSILTDSLLCPQSYAGAQASFDDLIATCPNAAAGLSITFSQDNTLLTSVATDGNGIAEYSFFETGEVEINETPPAGFFIRAFCEITANGTHSDKAEYQNPIVQPLPDGSFSCALFLIAAVPTGNSTVYVNKHNCPARFDAAGADINGLAAGCQAPGTDGVSFTLFDDNGFTVITAGGIASWANVIAGQLSIIETFPSGYSFARAFCNTKNSAGDETGFGEYPVDPTGKLIGAAKDGFDFYCDWYDIPTPSPLVNITITKYDCPQSAIGSANNIGTLLQTCALAPNIVFDLISIERRRRHEQDDE